MKPLKQLIAVCLAMAMLSACDSEGTSSSSAASADASHCVSRVLRTVYANDCNYDIYVIIFEAGATAFKIRDNDATTRSTNRRDFGACRAPLRPVLNRHITDYRCV